MIFGLVALGVFFGRWGLSIPFFEIHLHVMHRTVGREAEPLRLFKIPLHVQNQHTMVFEAHLIGRYLVRLRVEPVTLSAR